MAAEVRSVIRRCVECAKRKSPTKTRKAPLQQRAVGAPMERVALDIVGPLPETAKRNKYILVVGDYLSKWMEAYPLADQTAEAVAETFVKEFVCRFSVPEVLLSDQGSNFESQVFTEMCHILGIDKARTCPYNPKSDGLIERFNRTLVNMVPMMIEPERRQRDWDEKLPLATFAYRATPQESTGESPNMLMLGREVRLPIDLTTEATTDEKEPEGVVETDYANELRRRLRAAHERARICLLQSARRQKTCYDRRTTSPKLEPGNFVWLHNPAKKKGLSPKLQCRWEGPYLIMRRLLDVVYRIQRRKKGKMKVVHCDRLKPYAGELIKVWTIDAPTGDSSSPEAVRPACGGSGVSEQHATSPISNEGGELETPVSPETPNLHVEEGA
ncbi:protein NYNRIN-like [Acanthaster planci]|uniref:Protein NYNRIN-like n=1 Tax=Acanthaster planci TaxID=133434 RepID=A0A8B8A153_ACAPL|nr:protein NYNRIN-like [Acanthaster planci]